MPKMSVDERDAFLSVPGILLHLAVARDNGFPLLTPIWFIYEENRIWFTPRKESAWFAELRRDPRASLCIDDQSLPYRKVIIEGVAELIYDLGEDDVWRDRYRRIAERYTSPEAASSYIHQTIDQPRALYSVPLADAKITTWRMPIEGEPGDGIWAQRYYGKGTKLRRD